MQEVYINLDDSGKLSVHESVSVYGGILFLSKKEKDKFITQYRSIIKDIKCKYCSNKDNCNKNCPEIKNIMKAKLEIIEGLNGPLIINNDKVYVHIINDKKAKGRFLDYGLRRMIKEVINEQIKNNNIDSYRPLKVIINIDEQSTKSNGYYNLQDGLMEELKYGIKNFNYDNVFTPIVHDKLDLHIKYQDSSKSYLVQAADLISGTIRRMVLNEDDVNEFLNFKIILPWKKAT